MWALHDSKQNKNNKQINLKQVLSTTVPLVEGVKEFHMFDLAGGFFIPEAIVDAVPKRFMPPLDQIGTWIKTGHQPEFHLLGKCTNCYTRDNTSAQYHSCSFS